MEQEQQLRTFKDFLYFYNVLSETCFYHCVDSFNGRYLEDNEATCVERCCSKFIHCNHRLIKLYAGVQEKLVNKRIQQALEDEKLKATPSTDILQTIFQYHMMACFWQHVSNTHITIPEVREIGGITFYRIEIRIDTVVWTVSHRYSEFFELHQALSNDHGVSKGILPPKRTIRNKCPEFIEIRRRALEVYMRNIFHYLKRTMPRIFVEFLDFHKYDIFYLLRNMAFQFYLSSDSILKSKRSHKFNPVELYSIYVSFKEPFPNIMETDDRYDLSHVLDLCSQLSNLTVIGNTKKYLSSNIEPNTLPLDFSAFKCLESLCVQEMSLDKVCNVGNLRRTLKTFALHRTNTTALAQILQCDILHKTKIDDSQVWTRVTKMDLSLNNIIEIDKTINLVPNVIILNLNHNKISSIGNLMGLTKLTHLYVADNLLCECENLHTKLGNILTLDLSENSITTLQGFSKLYSLESLNLTCNNIVNITELNYIGGLPCLENLMLTGNKIATVVDYRSKVFEYFGSRAKDICLDNEKPAQGELDKAALFKALTIVREGKTPVF